MAAALTARALKLPDRKNRYAPHRRDKRTVRLYTTAFYGHQHIATFDAETGDGETDEVEGHKHKVRGLDVFHAGKWPHVHRHELTRRRSP